VVGGVLAGRFYARVTAPQQYATTLPGGREETYGSRYVFGFIDRSTVSTKFRMGFTVKPDMNLDVYAEPFAASGHYYDYGELLEPKSRLRLKYGTEGTTLVVNEDGSQTVTADGSTFTLRNRDFNTLSFRSNVVLRWEWRPGSTLFVVWPQALSELVDLAASGKLKWRESIAEGLENAPSAFLGMLKGRNFGKQLVKLA